MTTHESLERKLPLTDITNRSGSDREAGIMVIDILHRNAQVEPEFQVWIERRVRFALGRFVARIHRVAVMFDEFHSPRGRSGQRCRLLISLIPAGNVVVEDVDSTIESVASRAVERAARAVVRELERQRVYRGESERVVNVSRLLGHQ